MCISATRVVYHDVYRFETCHIPQRGDPFVGRSQGARKSLALSLIVHPAPVLFQIDKATQFAAARTPRRGCRMASRRVAIFINALRRRCRRHERETSIRARRECDSRTEHFG